MQTVGHFLFAYLDLSGEVTNITSNGLDPDMLYQTNWAPNVTGCMMGSRDDKQLQIYIYYIYFIIFSEAYMTIGRSSISDHRHLKYKIHVHR